jgi:hypothetical protein
MTQRMAIGLQDVSPNIDPVIAMQELFTFSPFGLGCRQCTNTLQFNWIRDALPDISKNMVWTAGLLQCLLFDTFQITT